MNILLQDKFGTPHETIPFNLISAEDFEPAIIEGMRQEKEAIQHIIDNPESPTFANTILPKTGTLLERAVTVFYNLQSAHTSDELDALAQKLSPILTEHENSILHNARLFQRVRFVYENPGILTAEEQTLLNNVYEKFVRSGAYLTEKEKEKLSSLEMELSELTVLFNQNMLKETNFFQLHIQDADDLAGLPQSAIDAAAQAASEQNKDGWIFTLHAPSYLPFMTYAQKRHLRERMYMARNTICCKGNEYDNQDIVRKIVNLRQQIAQVLGFQNYAEYALKRRMAENISNVNTFLTQLLDAYLPIAKKELAELEEMVRENESPDFQLMPWDYAYYSHQLKLKHYQLDQEMLRPYLPIEQVCRGVFGLATKLYGITFRENSLIPVYHPDVKAYEVFDADGTYLAVLYADFYPRTSKQSGAWMTNYAEQYVDEEGKDHRPHVSITMNFTKPTADKPSLLTLSEVETFLHEFGHALHSIFSQVHFQGLSGTNVRWDFVEFPSQFMENYLTQSQFLQTFALHYQTGEPIPEELIERVRRSRNFHCGYQCVRQLSFSLLDMAYYTLQTPLLQDIKLFESEAWRAAQLLPDLPDTCMSVQFGHIMSGGYAAGYYSYKWAEVLDADAFSLFLENGIFDKQTAHRLRTEILSKGGSQQPMELYERFRGRKPSIESLLRRNGINTENSYN